MRLRLQSIALSITQALTRKAIKEIQEGEEGRREGGGERKERAKFSFKKYKKKNLQIPANQAHIMVTAPHEIVGRDCRPRDDQVL